MTLSILHSRLSHVSSSKLKILCSTGVLGQTKYEDFDCTSYKLGKHHALPFRKSDSISTTIFYLVHTDIRGPSPIPNMGGVVYFVTFMDDYSRFTWIYFMKHQSRLSHVYASFLLLFKPNFLVLSKLFE